MIDEIIAALDSLTGVKRVEEFSAEAIRLDTYPAVMLSLSNGRPRDDLAPSDARAIVYCVWGDSEALISQAFLNFIKRVETAINAQLTRSQSAGWEVVRAPLVPLESTDEGQSTANHLMALITVQEGNLD